LKTWQDLRHYLTFHDLSTDLRRFHTYLLFHDESADMKYSAGTEAHPEWEQLQRVRPRFGNTGPT
jgi:hypothetical protein